MRLRVVWVGSEKAAEIAKAKEHGPHNHLCVLFLFPAVRPLARPRSPARRTPYTHRMLIVLGAEHWKRSRIEE